MRYLKKMSLTIIALGPVINLETGAVESYEPRLYEINGIGFSANELFNHFCEYSICKKPVLHNAKMYKAI